MGADTPSALLLPHLAVVSLHIGFLWADPPLLPLQSDTVHLSPITHAFITFSTVILSFARPRPSASYPRVGTHPQSLPKYHIDFIPRHSSRWILATYTPKTPFFHSVLGKMEN